MKTINLTIKSEWKYNDTDYEYFIKELKQLCKTYKVKLDGFKSKDKQCICNSEFSTFTTNNKCVNCGGDVGKPMDVIGRPLYWREQLKDILDEMWESGAGDSNYFAGWNSAITQIEEKIKSIQTPDFVSKSKKMNTKDKLGDDFTKFLESEGYEVIDDVKVKKILKKLK